MESIQVENLSRWVQAVLTTTVVVLMVSASMPVFSQIPPPRCNQPIYHQMDFWLGEWEVRNPKGGIEGTNEITKEHRGCVLIEHWSSPDQTGISLNFYDFRSKRWHQQWVDSLGNTLTLSGGLINGRMTLTGNRLSPDGNTAFERNVWFNDSLGRLRNVWDFSVDGGRTWSVRFDGVYIKRLPAVK